MSNNHLQKARTDKKDEFYTQLSDIEKELRHYEKLFKNKTVLCNCDDPRVSNFFRYFSSNFEKLGLKKLVTTCYKNQQTKLFSQYDSEKAIYFEYKGDNNKVPDPNEIDIVHLKSDGDFRNQECIDILKQVDIVVTNPPFSLFREYVEQLMKYKKKFLIIGSINAVSYNSIFKPLKDNKIWLGENSGVMKFKVHDNYEPRPKDYGVDNDEQKWCSFGNICWFTNLENDVKREELILTKLYNSKDYPKYDSYNAINVDKTKEIPIDYDGIIGVLISFMHKYNPDQFEIIDAIGRYSSVDGPTDETRGKYLTEINKKRTYARIIIKHKKINHQ